MLAALPLWMFYLRARLGVSLVFCLWTGFELGFMDRIYNRSWMNNAGIARLSMPSGQGRGESIQQVPLGKGWAGRAVAFLMIGLVGMGERGC